VVLIPSLALLQLAAGGVLVGLMAGGLTRRLLRLLRWHGASASQVSACSGAPMAACRPPLLLFLQLTNSAEATLCPARNAFVFLSCSW
jgi:hypothetical protein